MKISRDIISPTKTKLTITLGKEELEAAKSVALTKLAKNVKAPGFRKGNVPASVAAKHVSQAELAEATVDNAVSKAVAEAFMSEDIQVIERPQVEVKKFVPFTDLEFTAEAEVLPAITLGDYKKLTLPEQKKVSTTKKQVDEVLERIQKQMATPQDVERAAKNGDTAVIDFVGKKGGEAFEGGTGNDYPLELGSGSFIPGFEEAVVGMKAGDKKDIELTFPDDYHAKDLAGQKVTFETTVKKVQALDLPALDDEFAAKAGSYTSLEELRNDVKNELTARAKSEQSDALRDDLVSQLVASSEIPTPDVLVDDQARSIEQDMTQNLMYQGATLEQMIAQKGYSDTEEWRSKEVRPIAMERVKAGLALSELSKQENITVSKDELAARVAEFKKQYESQPETAARFDTPDVQRDIENRLMTEKTIDRLVELNSKK